MEQRQEINQILESVVKQFMSKDELEAVEKHHRLMGNMLGFKIGVIKMNSPPGNEENQPYSITASYHDILVNYWENKASQNFLETDYKKNLLQFL